MSDQLAQINNAAHQGAFGHNPRSEPTLAQLAAGNYKKGVVMVKGLSIAIENPAYTYRKGMDKSGKEWMCLMQAHYGYIQGHKGNDGDEMDVFIGNVPENDTVYIVNQKTADGYFDEHKIMLGFLSQQQAVDTYQHCFERGWTGLMSVVPCTMTQFKWWLANGNKSRPVTLDRLPYAGLERLDSVIWGGNDGSDLASHSGQVHKLLYQIRQCDDTHQALEPLSYNDLVQELCNQGFMYENYDALVVEYNKLEKKAKQLLMVMQGAASSVKPIGVTVGKPLTKGGVANVVAWFEMDDGQAVGVFFHNPDKTPKKIDPTDEMISYKWVLNKKDITIAVAPEQGKDLIIRTVAKRIMQLVEKNHDRFIKANGDKAALNQAEQDLTAKVAEKQATLKSLQDDVAALQAKKVEQASVQKQQNQLVQQPEPVTLTSKELGDFPDTPEGKKELRAAAKAEFEKLLGEWVDCPALNSLEGENTKVEIRKRGMKEFFAFSGDPRKLKLVSAIKQIISTATLTSQSLETNYKQDKKKEIVGYYHLVNHIKIDEKVISVRIVVEKDQKGLLHYDVIVPKETLATENLITIQGQSPSEEVGKPTLDSILDSGEWVVNLCIEGEPLEVVVEEDVPVEDNPTLSQERPSNWRTNLADARAVAKSLGIETKAKKLERLVKDVYIFEENETKKDLLAEFVALKDRLVLPTGYVFDLKDAERAVGDVSRGSSAYINKTGNVDNNDIAYVELRTTPNAITSKISRIVFAGNRNNPRLGDKLGSGMDSVLNAKQAIADMESHLINVVFPAIEYQKVVNSTSVDVVDLPTLGVATITSVGSENINIEKDGKYYISKVGNTEHYALGEWDFAKYPEGNVPVSEPQPVTTPSIGLKTPIQIDAEKGLANLLGADYGSDDQTSLEDMLKYTNWNTSLSDARAVAKKMGISLIGKSLEKLKGEIDKAIAKSEPPQPVSEPATPTQEDQDREFLQSAIDEKINILDAANVNKLAELSKVYTQGDMNGLIKQAKQVAIDAVKRSVANATAKMN